MSEEYLEFFEIRNLVRDLFRIFMKRMDDQVMEEMKITHEQFGLLLSISQKDHEVIQQDMAACMKKDKTVILRMIDVLEEKGLIRRVADKNDRRRNQLLMTKEGTRLINIYLAIGKQIFSELQKGIDPEELKVFYKIVRQLSENTQKL